ncbi:class I SAM-dependent DNA methyltransferase [Clostridium perfringens]|uniref:class I SAM-dependent DNA methyltransferase n=1 Tax=Clostridium perfringens TaxID=1502 RepID=UPI0018E3FD15|nr:DNA methyltransferase [Clostridium perfringens]MBI6058756.1 class I SAM-dependent DNA methyltransferase [Clostridium perfringens]MDB2061266.1 N-6 DNA methylase [Clostridium perfringens]MDB2064423.1 N-6 DNA methylase [Clostridium perfringens]MDB2066900.1 N-6 DNA methylase [Clostridium perfringens]
MNLIDIEKNIKNIINIINEDKQMFIFELLRCYGIPKASITKLQKGNLNISKNQGEILWKNKLFFKECSTEKIYEEFSNISESEEILRNNPMFIILTDYKQLVSIDIETKETLDININDIVTNYTFFLPWAGMKKAILEIDNPADVKAAEKMMKMYDEIKKENSFTNEIEIHELNMFLARLLFCFFAEDTGIFKEKIFTKSIASYTQQDGSDLDIFLKKIFKVLNEENRNGYPEYLEVFPYVGGELFEGEGIELKFNSKSRQAIIENGELNWSKVNPDIFGSMIQAVVNEDERSNLGMHYTSIPNIMKVINALFLDELNEEFEANKNDINKLKKIIDRLSKIKIFDPACGSGNFLIIAYKEIRELEMKIINQINRLDRQLYWKGTSISLSQFYGIELKDFAQQIAKLSLWLIEKKMDFKFYKEFGYSKPSLPLRESSNIINGNATRMDWNDVCKVSKNDEVYVLGNPPYLGARVQDSNQKKDLDIVFKDIKKYKNLDYISCWFYRAAKYIKDRNAKCAFVSTNSICQGEQVELLWPHIFDLGISINFAYTSFKWQNNAKGKAGVSCIIIGLCNENSNIVKRIYTNGIIKVVKNINPYLIEGKNIVISRRGTPLSKLPEIKFGNMPNDGGGLILTEVEKNKLITDYPQAKKFIKKYIGSEEFIKGKTRWCLWIEDSDLDEALNIKPIVERIQKVREHRLKSKDKGTNKLAERSHQFRDLNTSKNSAIIIPRVSSERREYIPTGFLDNYCIISDSAQAIYDSEPWILGVITSKMHMVWVKNIGGRLETRIRYSADICYNTFPFPEISKTKKEVINQCVFNILEEREKFPEKNLADLYDPDKMPDGLKSAHEELDSVIDRCYSKRNFNSDEERLECLFDLYEKMI